MSIIDSIEFWSMLVLGVITVAVVVFYVRHFFPSYFSEKAKNLATKEDVATITQLVESVKTEHSGRLETLKARLEKGKHAHQRQYDLELDVYKALWKDLVELREATASLRPVVDVALQPEETEEQRQRERGKPFMAAARKLRETIENNKPFYPLEIWKQVHELREIAWKEAMAYRFDKQERNWEKYWDKQKKHMDQIITLSDAICELIRSRMSHISED